MVQYFLYFYCPLCTKMEHSLLKHIFPATKHFFVNLRWRNRIWFPTYRETCGECLSCHLRKLERHWEILNIWNAIGKPCKLTNYHLFPRDFNVPRSSSLELFSIFRSTSSFLAVFCYPLPTSVSHITSCFGNAMWCEYLPHPFSPTVLIWIQGRVGFYIDCLLKLFSTDKSWYTYDHILKAYNATGCLSSISLDTITVTACIMHNLTLSPRQEIR